MKVGDLVIYKDDKHDERYPYGLGSGLVISFDIAGDPIIMFLGDDEPDDKAGSAYYTEDIEVISESR